MDLVQCFQNTLILPTLTPQTAIFGWNSWFRKQCFLFRNNKVFIDHVLLIFKLYVYDSWEKKFIDINNLITEMQKVKKIEKEIALNNSKKTVGFTKNST